MEGFVFVLVALTFVRFFLCACDLHFALPLTPISIEFLRFPRIFCVCSCMFCSFFLGTNDLGWKLLAYILPLMA